MARNWLITGCSSGLGRALAVRLAAEGERVLATARRPETLVELTERYPDNIVTTGLDVGDQAQCQAAVDLAVATFGGLDILVNNAAFGQFGAVEEVSDAELAAQFDTNVFGPWRLTRTVLPLWRARGAGHVLFVGSVSGLVAFPGLAAYTASKFALEGLGEALAAETAHLGIKVTILQPGGFATNYGESLTLPGRRVEAYAPVTDGTLGGVRTMKDNKMINSPELFADVVWRLSQMETPPLRLPVGADAESFLAPVYAARMREYDDMIKGGHHVGA